MPVYTYRCMNEGCNSVCEITHYMNETVITCPNCASDNLKKLPSNISVAKNTNNKKRNYRDACDDAKETLSAGKESLKGRTWKQ